MGKTGRLNLEMNDWMGNQNKKREKLTDSDILKQFEQAEKDTRFLLSIRRQRMSLTRSGHGSRRSRLFSQRFPIQRIPNHPVKPAGAL
mgnify:FL=1